MELKSLIKEEHIQLSLQATTREEVLQKMTETLVQTGSVRDQAAFVDAVLTREGTGSTGIGFSVAIPHGKSQGVAQPGLAYAHLETPVEWNSMDGKPVSLVFLIAVPEEQAGNEHLKILVALSRKLIHAEFRQQLAEAKSSTEIYDILGTL